VNNHQPPRSLEDIQAEAEASNALLAKVRRWGIPASLGAMFFGYCWTMVWGDGFMGALGAIIGGMSGMTFLGTLGLVLLNEAKRLLHSKNFLVSALGSVLYQIVSWLFRPFLRHMAVDLAVPIHEKPKHDYPAVHGAARWATDAELTARKMLQAPGDTANREQKIILGVHPSGQLVTHASDTGIITIGETGSGKWLTSVGLNLFNYRGGSMLVFDPKGEIAATTAAYRAQFGKVVVLNPFDVLYETPAQQAAFPFMKPARFNPLAKLNGARRFDDLVADFVKRLIAEEEKADANFFIDGARAVLAGVLSFIWHSPAAIDAKGRPFAKSLTGVQDMLRQPPAMLTAYARVAIDDERPCMHLAREGLAEWAYALGNPEGDGAKNRGHEWPKSIMNTLETVRRQLNNLLDSEGIRHTLSGSDFEWHDLRRERCTVYIVLPRDKVERFARFTSLLLDEAMGELAKEPGDDEQSVYMVLDEVATALRKRMRWIGEAYNIARGQRVVVHAYFQNFSQVLEAFKHPGEITSAAGSTTIYQNQDQATIEAVQKWAGDYTSWIHMVSNSQSFNPQRDAAQPSSTGQNEGFQHFKQPLITAELIKEGLGVPTRENGFEARQIIFVQGMAAPLLTKREAYFNLNPAWAKHRNPYAPRSAAAQPQAKLTAVE
jgi:type IV secretion system protein VirD4